MAPVASASGDVGASPTIASFYPTGIPSHIQTYSSSSDSENDDEKFCHSDAQNLGSQSSVSTHCCGLVMVIEEKRDPGLGTPGIAAAPGNPAGSEGAPPPAVPVRDNACPFMPALQNQERRVPAQSSRIFSGNSGAPDVSGSQLGTEKGKERSFPPPSIYRTDSVDNLASDPLVDTILLPDRSVNESPIFYTDPTGNISIDPPPPAGENLEAGDHLPEGSASHDSIMDEVNASVMWQLYNNVQHDTQPSDPPEWPEGEGAPVPRRTIPPNAIFLELNPVVMRDLFDIVPAIRSSQNSAPLELLAGPVWAAIPANFWLCEDCWGIWAREELEYTQSFQAAQANYLDLVPDDSTEVLFDCPGCRGVAQTYIEAASADNPMLRKKWHMYHGERFDHRGRWRFVGKAVSLVAPTDSANIMRISLLDHGITGSPIPPIGFYRTKSDRFSPPPENPEKPAKPQYASKSAAKKPPPRPRTEDMEESSPSEDIDPREVQNHRRDFRMCDSCLGYWVKKTAPYAQQWIADQSRLDVNGIRKSYFRLRWCAECRGEILFSEWRCGGKINPVEWTRGHRVENQVGWWYVGSDIRPVVYPWAPDDIGSVNVHLPELMDGNRPNHIQQNVHLKFEVGRPHLKPQYSQEWAEFRQKSPSTSPATMPAASGEKVQGQCNVVSGQVPGSPPPTESQRAEARDRQNYDICQYCLGFWAKESTPYTIKWMDDQFLMLDTGIRDSHSVFRTCPLCKGEILHSEWSVEGQTHVDEWTASYRWEGEVLWWYVGSDIRPVGHPPAPGEEGTINVYLPELMDSSRPQHICYTFKMKFEPDRPHFKPHCVREWEECRPIHIPGLSATQPARSDNNAQGQCCMIFGHESDYIQSEDGEGDNGQDRESVPVGTGPLAMFRPDQQSTDEDTDTDDSSHVPRHHPELPRSQLYYALEQAAGPPMPPAAFQHEGRELVIQQGGGTDSESELQPVFLGTHVRGPPPYQQPYDSDGSHMLTDGEKNVFLRVTDRPEPAYPDSDPPAYHYTDPPPYPDSDPPAYRTDSPGPDHAPPDQGPIFLGRRPRERQPPADDRPYSSADSPPEKCPRRDSPMHQDHTDQATSSAQQHGVGVGEGIPAFWPPAPDQQDAPAMTAHELTNKLLYVEGWCNDLQVSARSNFEAAVQWTNTRVDEVWEKVQTWDPLQHSFLVKGDLIPLEKNVSDTQQQVCMMGNMIGDQAEKIERISKKLQSEIIEVISQTGDQKTQFDQWQKIMGDSLHQHHQRILHLEENHQQGPATAPGPASPIAPILWSDVNGLKQEVENNNREVQKRFKDFSTLQRLHQHRIEEGEEKMRAMQKKMEGLSQKGQEAPPQPAPSGMNMERIWRTETTLSELQTKVNMQENVVQHMDHRLLELEKRLDTWVPPQVFQNEMARISACFEHMGREQEALKHALDTNTRWTVKKFDSLSKGKSPVGYAQQPCSTPVIQHQTPGIGDFSPTPYSAPALVLDGSPDPSLQKKMQRKGRGKTAVLRTLVAPPPSNPAITVADMSSIVQEMGAQLGNQLGAQIEQAVEKAVSEKSSEAQLRKLATKLRPHHPPDSDRDSSGLSSDDEFRLEPPVDDGKGGGGQHFAGAAAASGGHASVNVVGAQQPANVFEQLGQLVGLMNPVHGIQILQSAKKPAPFSGREGGDWQQFTREWKPYERLLEQAYPVHNWNTVKLEHLKQLLDPTTLAGFQAQFESKGTLTFAEYWDSLDREFGKDPNLQNRAAWRKVSLRQAGKRLTSQEWRAYHNEFMLKRGRVYDRTDMEEYQLIFSQLDPYWSGELTKEESKRSTGTFWVRLLNLPDMTADQLYKIMRDHRCHPIKCMKSDNGFLVRVKSEEDRDRAIKLEGHTIKGQRIKVQRAKPKLSPEEIFSFIADRLQTKEEHDDLRRELQPPRTDHYHSNVHEVNIEVIDKEPDHTSEKKGIAPAEPRPPSPGSDKPKPKPLPKAGPPRRPQDPSQPPRSRENQHTESRGWGHQQHTSQGKGGGTWNAAPNPFSNGSGNTERQWSQPQGAWQQGPPHQQHPYTHEPYRQQAGPGSQDWGPQNSRPQGPHMGAQPYRPGAMRGQPVHYPVSSSPSSGQVYSQQTNQSYGKGGVSSSTWSNPPVNIQATSVSNWQNQPARAGKGGPPSGKGGGKGPGFVQGSYGPPGQNQSYGRGKGQPLQSGLTIYQNAMAAGKGGGGLQQQSNSQQGSDHVRVQR